VSQPGPSAPLGGQKPLLNSSAVTLLNPKTNLNVNLWFWFWRNRPALWQVWAGGHKPWKVVKHCIRVRGDALKLLPQCSSHKIEVEFEILLRTYFALIGENLHCDRRKTSRVWNGANSSQILSLQIPRSLPVIGWECLANSSCDVANRPVRRWS